MTARGGMSMQEKVLVFGNGRSGRAAAELLRYDRSRTSLEPFVRRWSFFDIKIQNDEKD